MRFILLLSISALIIGSCKKDHTPKEVTISSIWECAQKTSLPDSAATVHKLIGSWKLISRFCGWTGDVPLNGVINITTFKSDGTFTITEDGTQVSSGTWYLTKVADNMWRVGLNTVNIYTTPALGTVAFCGQYASFDAGLAVDGCASILKKTH